MAKAVRVPVTRVIDNWFEIGGDGPFREPGQLAPVEGEAPPEKPKPEPRKLRTELYRNFGCYPDLDELTGASADKARLIDWALDKVARSFVQQRERLLDLVEGLVEEKLDEFCPERGHAEDWDLDGLKVALKEQFNLDVDVKVSIAERERPIIGEKVWK